MKILKCKLCSGEIDILYSDHPVLKKVKCLNCGYSNAKDVGSSPLKSKPEVEIIVARNKKEEE